MKIYKNQTGAVDIILILIVFVLAAGLGGYVYYNQRQAQKSYAAAGSGATVSKHSVKKSASKTTTPSPAPSPTPAPVSSTGVYAGWNTYDFKGWFTFKYPNDYHISTEGEGVNTIAITSYDPTGSPTGFHCASSGFSVPVCEVKVELTHLSDGSIGSGFFPSDSQLKSTAQLIIASAKKD